MKVTEQIVGSHKESAVMKFLRGQVSRAFNLANQNLRTLDNGGYKVKFNGTIQRLESSDVKIKKTYVDRLDGNKTKKFDQSNIFSHTFTFQEAVEKMPDRSLFSTEVLDDYMHHCRNPSFFIVMRCVWNSRYHILGYAIPLLSIVKIVVFIVYC